MSNLFKGLFDTALTATISPRNFLICLGVSLMLGLVLALAYSFKSRYTGSFLLTLALLPAIVCVVIMMVNGNIGAGVAVAGAFSLVRFRSAPGTAREIAAIFLAMSAGLISGMGYLGYASLFTLIMCAVFMIYSALKFGTMGKTSRRKTVKITIPEDLDYTTVFDGIFEKYTTECELVKVKTANMGSMFRLTYNLLLRDITKEKEFIDELRTRNGNLEIMVSREESPSGEL